MLIVGAALVGACFLLAGCGSGKPSPTTTVSKVTRPATSDEIRVFFRKSATRSQEKADGTRLRREPCVRRVAFVSKAQALKLMKKRFPGLYQAGLPTARGNPFPDSFTVTASKLSCVPTIGAAVAHWPGVATVRWRT